MEAEEGKSGLNIFMIGFNCDGIDSIYCISNDIYLNNEIDYPKGVKK